MCNGLSKTVATPAGTEPDRTLPDRAGISRWLREKSLRPGIAPGHGLDAASGIQSLRRDRQARSQAVESDRNVVLRP